MHYSKVVNTFAGNKLKPYPVVRYGLLLTGLLAVHVVTCADAVFATQLELKPEPKLEQELEQEPGLKPDQKPERKVSAGIEARHSPIDRVANRLQLLGPRDIAGVEQTIDEEKRAAAQAAVPSALSAKRISSVPKPKGFRKRLNTSYTPITRFFDIRESRQAPYPPVAWHVRAPNTVGTTKFEATRHRQTSLLRMAAQLDMSKKHRAIRARR